jgi:hypothetical protein
LARLLIAERETGIEAIEAPITDVGVPRKDRCPDVGHSVGHPDAIEQPQVDSQPIETDAPDVDEQPSPATTIVKSATGQPIAASSTTTSSTTTSSTTTTSTDPPAPSTTAATTTTVGDQPQPERFDSACGWVLAPRSSTSVELIEIHAGPGYDARPEDPDQGNTTVQFTGPGEDCELKITVSGTPPHSD